MDSVDRTIKKSVEKRIFTIN